MRTKLFLALILSFTIFVNSQNWPTIGGKNERNGLTKITGPDSVLTPFWSINSSLTQIGNSVFTFGNKFVTSRSVFSPYTAKIECRSLTDGNLLWEMMASSSSRMFAVGFTEDAVYAHDYLTDTLYALSPEDGSIKWKFKETNFFGGNTGLLFAENGDPILRGKRLDRKTGQVKWFYNYIVPVMPNAGFAAKDSIYYHYSGGIGQPIRLFALNLNSGQFKYQSDALPGAGDQEWPVTVGSDGTIYLTRDGGKLYSFEDTGSQLRIKWTYTPSATEMPGHFANDKAGNLYVIDNDTVKLLDKSNGTVIAKSRVRIKSSFFPNITVDEEGKVYVNNNEAALGKIVCLSADLQNVLWEMDVPYITYCGPALSKDGTLIIAGAGTNIRAYKTNKKLKPVADFRVSKRDIVAGNTVTFFDQSSFGPTSWQWFFQGGTPSTSTLQTPVIKYDTPGVYEVKLVASNNLGSDTLIKKSYIYVENPVEVDDVRPNDIKFYLSQNYPNPFNPSTVISYQLPENGMVSLKVYDILGNEVATLVDEYKEAGRYEIEFNLGQAIAQHSSNSLSAGVYIYRLKVGEYTSSRKMLLIK